MPDQASERRRLGLRLRDLRRGRSLTTRDLGARASLSSSMISQIETGRVDASVGSLRRLAFALGVPLAAFFLPHEDTGEGNGASQTSAVLGVVRRHRRKRLQLPESRVVYELLTPNLKGNIEFVWIELEPDHPPSEAMSHPGQECVIVIQGTLHLVVGDEQVDLEAGDSISFDSAIPHHIENRGREKMIQISAITPPAF